ncbi:MAG: SelB C-terminal domain-containing protein [Pseudonocardiaceae bacterium]
MDRAFTIHGAGTVVTATLAGGTLRVGDELELGLSRRRVTVRGLQSLGAPTESVPAVARVAVNLRGVPREAVRCGDALLTPGAWLATGTVDVRLSTGLAAELPRQVVPHTGTAAVAARVRPLGGDTARLSVAHPLPLRIGDRAAARSRYSAHPRRGHRAGCGPTRAAPPRCGAARRTDRDGRPRARWVPQAGGWLVDPALLARRAAQLADAVAARAAAHPLEPGLPLETARQVTGLPDARLVELLLGAVPPARGLALTKGRVHLAGPVSGRFLDCPTRSATRSPPSAPSSRRGPSPHPRRTGSPRSGWAPKNYATAVRAGQLLKIADGIYLAPGAGRAAIERLRGLPSPFTLSQARQALDTTRRVAVPLLELLAHRRITRKLPTNTHELLC